MLLPAGGEPTAFYLHRDGKDQGGLTPRGGDPPSAARLHRECLSVGLGPGHWVRQPYLRAQSCRSRWMPSASAATSIPWLRDRTNRSALVGARPPSTFRKALASAAEWDAVSGERARGFGRDGCATGPPALDQGAESSGVTQVPNTSPRSSSYTSRVLRSAGTRN